MSHHYFSVCLLMTATLIPQAVNAKDSDKAPLGQETQQWLELQRSGYAASQRGQRVSGPIADAIYHRYVESFKHPIPENFQRERIANGGGSR